MDPDWAVTMIELERGAGGIGWLYPPQPASASVRTAITPAAKARFNLLDLPFFWLCHSNPMPVSVRGRTSPPVPWKSGKCGGPAELEEVVTVKVVLAIPAAVFAEGGAKPQVIPAGAWQEKLMLSANPPDGVTVTVNVVDCPAATVAAGGFVPNRKSPTLMVIDFGVDTLLSKFRSPE